MRRTIFVGSDPPPTRSFDWVVEPAARVALGDDAAIPDISVVKGLLDESAPVVASIATGRFPSLLRDEIFQLVLSVARAEATLRALDHEERHRVVSTRHLPRPSRPPRLAAGLARFLGAELEWVAPHRPARFPASVVGSGRALRWARSRRFDGRPKVIAAIGGPSERRALEPVVGLLDDAVMLDFALQPDPDLPGFGGYLNRRDAVSGVGAHEFERAAAVAWGSHDWWGSRWLPWVEPSLRVMSRITLREAVLFHRAASRALVGSEVLVTAKVRYARARAIVAAAAEMGVATVATQHGIYVDGNEWTDLRPDVFAVSGDAFAAILERRGYRGEVVRAGAPFYAVPNREWDLGIALQPPEGIVITSAADYERHATAAYRAARTVLGEHATIGFRLHPREDEAALRRIVGQDIPMSRDPIQGGKLWVTIESSFVVQAMLSGSPAILINLNGHPWEYRFAEMPGIAVAHDQAELEAALRRAVGAEGGVPVDQWRRQFAVATGAEAAATIARIIEESTS